MGVPPGLTAGGGLKRTPPGLQRAIDEVPPGLTAGGGLKHAISPESGPWEFPPASPPGAD